LGYNLITIHVVEYIFSLKSKGYFLIGVYDPCYKCRTNSAALYKWHPLPNPIGPVNTNA